MDCHNKWLNVINNSFFLKLVLQWTFRTTVLIDQCGMFNFRPFVAYFYIKIAFLKLVYSSCIFSVDQMKLTKKD